MKIDRLPLAIAAAEARFALIKERYPLHKKDYLVFSNRLGQATIDRPVSALVDEFPEMFTPGPDLDDYVALLEKEDELHTEIRSELGGLVAMKRQATKTLMERCRYPRHIAEAIVTFAEIGITPPTAKIDFGQRAGAEARRIPALSRIREHTQNLAWERTQLSALKPKLDAATALLRLDGAVQVEIRFENLDYDNVIWPLLLDPLIDRARSPQGGIRVVLGTIGHLAALKAGPEPAFY